jgi:membrane protease YdiL (CAAX protease family)
VNNYLLLVYAAACLLMNFSLAGLLQVEGLIVLSLSLPGIVSILIPFALLSRSSPYGFAGEFSLGRPDLRTTVLVLVVSASAILPVDAFSGLFERLWKPDADYTSFILSIKPKGPASFAAVAFGLVVVAAVTEELLFRGFLQRIFQRNMRGTLAVLLAGLLFSVSHFNLPVIPGIAALGILFGYLFYRTSVLWYSIMAHAVFNLVTLVRLNAMSEEDVVSAKVESPDPRWTALSLGALVISLWLIERLHRRARQ